MPHNQFSPLLQITQHNCAGSNAIFLSLFSSFSKKNPPLIVAIQEPCLFNNVPLHAPAYSCIFPSSSTNDKVLACFYVLKDWEKLVAYSPLFFDRSDFVGISFTFTKKWLSKGFTSLSIYNVYNKHVSRSERSVPPTMAFPSSAFPSLVLGDFNIHHHSTDPLRILSNQELALANPYFEAASAAEYALLNTPSSYTRISPTPSQRNGVIDLSFYNTSSICPFITRRSPPTYANGPIRIQPRARTTQSLPSALRPPTPAALHPTLIGI